MSTRNAVDYVLRQMGPRYGLAFIEHDGMIALNGDGPGLMYRAYKTGGTPQDAVRNTLPPTLTNEQMVDAVDTSLAVVAAMLSPRKQQTVATGTFRVYFNRSQAAPLVWCCALIVNAVNAMEGPVPSYEIAVADVVIDAPCRTVYAPKPTPDHEDGKPSAWIEVDGVLTIAGGVATIARAA